MFGPWSARDDSGAVAVLYATVLVFVLLPALVLGTTTLVRSTTTGELQRAADAGALAAAAAIPFGDVNFARNFVATTAGGPTGQTLRDLGLTYPGDDPKTIACDRVAIPDATDAHNVSRSYADAPACEARYLSDIDTITAVRQCADALATRAGGLPSGLPDLSPLLPVLIHPGVEVTMSWHVNGPLDSIIGTSGTTESFTSVAHRRFKNMVVIPEATLPTGQTINLNPLAGDVRTTVLDAIDGTERLLAASPTTAVCSGVLAGASDDIVDAIDPPNGGPDAQQILDDAIATSSPVVIARVVTALNVPYLDFVPVCAARVAGSYVGHLSSFGTCAVTSPGAFRASLRRP